MEPIEEGQNGMGVDLDEVLAENRQRILVVEDDPDTVVLLKQILRRAGFDVLSAANGSEALRKCSESKPDLLLLDIMMPDMDGWYTFEFLRKITNIPVIILSALSGKDHVVRALNIGIDDFISKPFYNDEVVARIHSVLRRQGSLVEVNRLIFPEIKLIIDVKTQEVILKDRPIQLTPKEFAVMQILAKHAPSNVSYRIMAEAVWGEDIPEARQRTKYLIYLLRKKLAEISPEQELIINIGRVGYKLQTEK